MTDSTKLICGGKVVLDQVVSRQDVLIQGEKIVAIGDLSAIKVDEKVDAEGLLVLPGGVDTHVHFNDEFMGTVSVHNFESGTKAAAFGGTTTVVDFTNQWPGGSLKEAMAKKHEEAEGQALIDWGVHPVITEPTPETLDEIPDMVAQGAPTIKCYMTYREEGIMTEREDLSKILARLHEHGGMLMVHAEDNDMAESNVRNFVQEGKTQAYYHAESKPAECEYKAIKDAIRVAKETGGRLFVVHLASDKGMRKLGKARAKGVDVLAETCTHYLLFTDDLLKREDGIKWICSPPLRDKEIQDQLWEGLQDGRICQVTSDDAAFSWQAKLFGQDRFDKCPNGMPGLETRMTLLYSEGVAKDRISLPRFVKLVSTAPARLFGMYPQKGSLIPGSDADIVLFDPTIEWKLNLETTHMAADWSPFDDYEVTGKVIKVFSRGDLIIDGDRCVAEKGRGQYLHRALDFSFYR